MKERNQPIFFRKLPSSEETKPNAVYKRSLGEIPTQGEVCEIEYHGQLWTVKESEALNSSTALGETAKKYHEQVESARKLAASNNGANNSPTLKLIAKAFGKSEGTLRKRMKFIKQYMPQI